MSDFVTCAVLGSAILLAGVVWQVVADRLRSNRQKKPGYYKIEIGINPNGTVDYFTLNGVTEREP